MEKLIVLLVCSMTLAAHASPDPQTIQVTVVQSVDSCMTYAGGFSCREALQETVTHTLKIETTSTDMLMWQTEVKKVVDGHSFDYQVQIAKNSYDTTEERPFVVQFGTSSRPRNHARGSVLKWSRTFLKSLFDWNPSSLEGGILYPNPRTYSNGEVFYRHSLALLKIEL